MPPLPPAGNVVRITWKATAGTDLDILTRLYWTYTGSDPSVGDLNTIALNAQGAWVSHLQALHADDITLVETTVYDLSSDDANTGVYASSDAGTRGASGLPGGTATLINFTIGRRYRGGKPKVFWPMGVQGDLDGPQTWSTAFVDAVGTAWDAFAVAISEETGGDIDLSDQVNVSYYKGFTVVTNPITGRARNVPTLRETPAVDAITSYSIGPKYSSQRRRNGNKR
jgi:hypothetical protein